MKIAQKNVLNMNMAFIHLFAFCIMTRVDSYACPPLIYAEYFGFPTRDFPAPFNTEVAHPCHVLSC
jgi:hypothetical protein